MCALSVLGSESSTGPDSTAYGGKLLKPPGFDASIRLGQERTVLGSKDTLGQRSMVFITPLLLGFTEREQGPDLETTPQVASWPHALTLSVICLFLVFLKSCLS